MSTTINMSLGLLFVVLAIVAVLLQAWRWGPQFWDDIGEKTRVRHDLEEPDKHGDEALARDCSSGSASLREGE